MFNIQRKSKSQDRSRIARVALVLLVGLSLALPAVAQDGRWFHVRVEEENGTEVSVNLPLSLIEMAAEMIPETAYEEIDIELNDAGFKIDDLRAMWDEVRGSGDATFVTVESDEATVKVRKEGDYFVAKTVESGGGANVDVRFPLQVIDALFSGGEHTLDFGAAIRALADFSDGDMVTVTDNDTSVRVWIDDSNESE